MKETIWNNIEKIREESPLVHNITNYVVMNNTANALLAAGASPVMAHAIEEVQDMVKIAGALVINMGTLSPQWVEAMKMSMEEAKRLGKPIIFDPVGVGATPYRNETAAGFITNYKPEIIRGNASEILATVSSEHQTKGVDSTASTDSATEAAHYLNQKYGAVVCISGAKDMIITNKKTAMIQNGHPLMAKITGMGCTATALIAAFAAVEKDPFTATLSAMSLLGVAGELSQKNAKGPGSMQIALLDKLYSIKKNEFMDNLNIEIKDV